MEQSLYDTAFPILHRLARLLPVNWLRWCVHWISIGLASYLRLRFPPFIVRPGTTDLQVVRDVFFLRRKLDINPKVIVDAGAYTGYSAIWSARKYPGAKIIAIEPEPSNYKTLTENVKRFPSIYPVNKALWPEPCRLHIVDRGVGHWGFMTQSQGTETSAAVEAITVPEILATEERIGILKIDIEGAEYELFSGDTSWMERIDVLMIELHDHIRPCCEQRVRAAIAGSDHDESVMGEYLVVQRIEHEDAA